MKEIGVPFVDTTPCVLEVGPDAGYVPNDTHYSPAGNAAVAKCLGAALTGSLPRTRRSNPARRRADGRRRNEMLVKNELAAANRAPAVT